MAIAVPSEIWQVYRFIKGLEVQAKEKEAGERVKTTGAIAHDIGGHLLPILASLESIEQYGSKHPEQVVKWIKRAKLNVELIQTLIHDFLVLSKAEAGALAPVFEPCGLDSVVQQIIATIYSAKHSLTFSTQGSPRPIQADKKLLTRAVHNLVSNAIKYSPEGGEVHVRIVYLDDWAEILVADQGIGLPQEFAKTFDFKVFERATNTGSIAGTGLGLSIAQTCAVVHGGSLVFESRPGLTLPGVKGEFNTIFCLVLAFRNKAGEPRKEFTGVLH